MTLEDIRDELRQARIHTLDGETATAVAAIDRALAELTPPRFVTTAEAATLLGIQLELHVQLWCAAGSLRCERVNGCWLVPLSEIERFAASDEVKMIRVSDRYHDASAELGSDAVDQEWLDDLAASRPGRLPWRE